MQLARKPNRLTRYSNWFGSKRYRFK